MLSEKEENLYLKSEIKKLKGVIEYLDSKNKKYLEVMEKLKFEIEKTEVLDDFELYTTNQPMHLCYKNYERISIPTFTIGYRGQQQWLLNTIAEAINTQ